jgi:hypothetical protein
MIVELTQESVLNYIHAHPEDCEYAAYISFKSKEFLDKRGRSGIIVLSRHQNLLDFSLRRLRWWSLFKRSVAYLQVQEIVKGEVFGIPICFAELRRNPVHGKRPKKPETTSPTELARIEFRGGARLAVFLPPFYGEVYGELEVQKSL